MSAEHRANKRGLTLVEVLLAVTFLSLGLVMMLTAISRCLGVLKIAEQYHEAMWALSAGETEYPLVQTEDTEPEDFEVMGATYGDLDYTRRVLDPDMDAPDSDLRLLLVVTEISWEGRGRRQVETIPRYVVYRER